MLKDSKKSLRQTIDDNPVVFYLSALLTGFIAGVGAYEGKLKFLDQTVVSSDSFRKSTSTHFDPIVQLVRSEGGEHAAASVNIVNSFGSDVRVYWIDTGGVEQPLGPSPVTNGQAYALSTFAKQLILIKDSATGEQLLLVEPRGIKAHAFTVEVTKPN